MKRQIQQILLVLLLCVVGTTAYAAKETYKLKFQSSDNSGNPNFLLKKEWAERVAQMTNNRVMIEVLSVGSVVKHTETIDAISAGILDGHITATGYFSGKDPAFGLLGNPVGAWSDPSEMLLFIEHGGGKELYQELLAPYGLHFIGASATGLEAFVSKKPLDSVADLKGLKLRAPEGLVQTIFTAAGAIPVNLPGSEVFTALDKGVIDAADYTVFSTNHQQGMHDIAPHPVYPGFHSLPVLEVSINKETWDSMPADLQTILDVSVRDFARQMVSRLKMADQKAVAEVLAGGKITIHDWSATERNKFRSIAKNEWEKYAKKSPNAQKVYKAITKFLADNGML
ncbi:TRAP transporter substrate-binding protein [Vibrio sp. SCSIO 43132]|uniref:TRAP transporter substrate-binding protein n=1 Tax=Vibrio sp. SCSIO 43132 TaxID=2779363 RepID=UPI001CA8CC23|nr:TRAP transporter substrate-binding protein [Vibrio sp. SCSIO 43132]UAB68844.1 TRAP transporter substrate-binding protein [Vibrio sp. SCSIO 43132]